MANLGSDLFNMLHHILNFGFLAKHSQSHTLINLAALFKTTYW